MYLIATTIYILVIFLYIYIVNLHRKELKAFNNMFKEQQRSNDIVMDYCIKHIISEYVKNEDYENASRAIKILKNLENLNNK
jgi:uncharacterized membrane protein